MTALYRPAAARTLAESVVGERWVERDAKVHVRYPILFLDDLLDHDCRIVGSEVTLPPQNRASREDE